MNKDQILGMTNTVEEEVTFETTAAFIAEGTPAVYSTPKLVALAEKACLEILKPVCEEGEVSVGVTISVTHFAPTPIGMKVFCTAKVEKVGKMVEFSFEARDEVGVIGTGTHTRAYAPKAAIEAKAAKKLNK